MNGSKWQTYGKAIIAFIFFLWTIIAPLITGDNHIDTNEWLIVGLGTGNGLLVYLLPLNPKWEYGKTVVNAVMASLAATQTVIADGLQPDDWTIILGAGLSLLIGWYAPAISMKGTTEETRVSAGFSA